VDAIETRTTASAVTLPVASALHLGHICFGGRRRRLVSRGADFVTHSRGGAPSDF